MRTTLNIDDDVLEDLQDIARVEKRPLGSVASEYLRRALEPTQRALVPEGESVMGFRAFAGSGRVVTSEMVNRLIDEDAV